LRFVVLVAKRYAGLGLPFMDLIQEGNIALTCAINRLSRRHTLEKNFSCYWWIKNGILRAVADYSRTIRLPVFAQEQLRQMSRESLRFLYLNGREPTNSELAERMDVAESRLQELKDYDNLIDDQIDYDEYTLSEKY
jgi:RNA polymerase primary sigma factor